jgi:hypothetical protein
MMQAGKRATLAVAASLLLVACAPVLPQRWDLPAEPTAGVPAGPGRPTASPRPTEPGWDEDSQAAAVAKAEALMEAFARPDLGEEEWWSGLAPLLSVEARLVYSAVDPANVPARRVTGTGKLLEGASAYIAQVQVPTDVGTYSVVLSRDSATAPWQGERITPPAGID